MNGIVWLASYPKSGNTWLRVVFANLQAGADRAVNINSLSNNGGLHHAADRRFFDEVVGYKASDLTHDEVDFIRPDLYRHVAAAAKVPVFCKAHDAFTMLPNGEPLFPRDASAGAIYVVRNPLDVCVSYSHHRGDDNVDAVVERMADPEAELAPGGRWLDSQLRQRLLGWSDHVRSWTQAALLPVHVVRYEDMHASPVDTFAAAAAFAGILCDRAAVDRAAAFSSIEELQRQEREHGFNEGVAPARPFFRKGKVGSWRDALTEKQAARIVRDHGDVMRRFGYLTDAGAPVY